MGPLRTASFFALVASASLSPLFARAETAGPAAAAPLATVYVPDAKVKAAEEKAGEWDFSLSLGANFALAQNRNIVGQPEGASYLIGAQGVGTGTYVLGLHELKLSLKVVESFTKSPIFERLVKANDLANLEALYSYYFAHWLGAFGRATFETPLLATEDIRADLVDYSITRIDGTVESAQQLKSFKLAGGLQPFTMSQSLGLVAKLQEQQPATITLRAGAGGRETLARNVLINKDNKATPEVELVETDSVLQAGAEVALSLVGKLPEQRLRYSLDFAALFPFLNNDARGRSVSELTRLGMTGAVEFSMFEWLGLSYQLLLARDVQLVEGLQVQNNVFVTFKYDLVPPKPVAKVDPLAEEKAARAAAEARATEAESRAKQAEEKLKELEAAPKAPTTPAP